ncbi:hypothetical protein Rleg5DRAFT_1992 [Rhizobium leguminosarum bv. viciae WSM1455]|nr:hypothetical protein Rleg5DRAFT_1992 [Rhizobium leguminosarum bv. viciae WSM1455]
MFALCIYKYFINLFVIHELFMVFFIGVWIFDMGGAFRLYRWN